MSLTPSQTLPFEAYKRLVEGFSAPMSVRDCKAPISSDTPEAITHDGSIVQVRPGIAIFPAGERQGGVSSSSIESRNPGWIQGDVVSLMLAPP